ncbi:Hypothetical protein LUCI_4935 [Lucifera butyrica]|uniref:Uncharacterized protein n=2 Tax=Lucifera butyrica TaxID=1351585 RepID=A0A498R659_9FIRM|nr:hypothetical protein [Lucifera butyrica]VBB06337.1 Hypothetical protein LUCI_1568 [Lucifera butyrica]VBB09463.1 Hypothetical protein LUCI_4758 [Lucifera butyrica]VBB09637.1 Hypothetical protein LUCI_4935 [Lucifera butyrica]
MTVPDSMEGAIILSVIDFLLSFVIIYGISLVLYIFPHLNKLGHVDESKLKGGH